MTGGSGPCHITDIVVVETAEVHGTASPASTGFSSIDSMVEELIPLARMVSKTFQIPYHAYEVKGAAISISVFPGFDVVSINEKLGLR